MHEHHIPHVVAGAECAVPAEALRSEMHSDGLAAVGENRLAFEKHAYLLSGSEMRAYKCTATFGYNFSWDGDADAEPSWVFGFDIHKVGDEEDRLDTPHMWKALTLLEWK